MLQAAELTIRLHPEDDVVIARLEIPAGTPGFGGDELAPWVVGATM